MNKTLLLDLDNTLLNNEMGAFIPAYLQSLARCMTPYADPGLLAKTLMAATSLMVQNQQPDLTLMEVFDAAFYPSLNLTKTNVQPTIDRFYADEFPLLRRLTSPRHEAAALVTQAFELGYQVSIATNPLFPLTAIQQRLAWAGLPIDQLNFSLVPSYSSFHFAKPNPAYFAEILAQMGWPNGPVVMVGDEAELDISGARQLGMAVFWTPVTPDASWTGLGSEPPKGSLSDVLPWIESTPSDNLKLDLNSPPALLAVLRSTPAALQTLCSSQDAVNWKRQPEPGEWSLTEVVCHLRDVENEVFAPRFIKVLNEDNPFLIGIETDPWAQQRQYIDQDGPQALRDFVSKRKELLSLLSDIPTSSWNRPARHAIFGPTHLQELAGIVSEHDRLHIQQISRLLKR